MTPRNQCGHCGRGGGEPRPWQDRFDLLCWSCNGWLVERERVERAEAERDAIAEAAIDFLDAVTSYMLGEVDGACVSRVSTPLRTLVWPLRAALADPEEDE